MKDKEARENIRLIARNVGIGIDFKGESFNFEGGNFLHRAQCMMRELDNISIKDCPKCKHPVMAHTSAKTEIVRGGVGWVYQCLTCGSKFTCSEKCVCELVKDD